jgi:hypothetical protein
VYGLIQAILENILLAPYKGLGDGVTFKNINSLWQKTEFFIQKKAAFIPTLIIEKVYNLED